ncbi:response regulator [Silvibacterium sp.]|uniref:response regulator n=1 Tax=Silvibacterium sp. TaxID=1964179 RepID=UPI0039E44B32
MLKPILLVEDNPNDLELSLAALAKSGLANDVVVTRDGAEARDYLYATGAFADRAPGLPAVVLLDLKLPKVDGLELLSMIRNTPGTERLPVVILTSSREEADVAAGYQLGSNAYVVKPVEFSAFFKAIQDLGIFWAVLNEPPPTFRGNPTNGQ